MKTLLAAVAALCTAQIALADTTVSQPIASFGSWTLKRGSTTVASGSGTQADCRARAQTDAESRHASANYTCAQTETDSFAVTYSAAPVVCPPTAPADTSKTISCSSPYFGTRQVTQGWTLHPKPTCWVNDGLINPPDDTSPPCSTVPPAAYSTIFPLVENPISEGSMWTGGKTVGMVWNDMETVAGRGAVGRSLMNTPSRYSDNAAVLNTTFSANQYAQGTVYKAAGYTAGGGSHEVELYLHFQITPNNARGYEVLWGIQGYIAIVRWNGPLGNYTALYDPGLNSAPVPQDGDVLRAEYSNGVIKVWINGVLKATTTESTWVDGQPGMGTWPVDGAANPLNMGWKNYQAGSLP